MPLTSEAKKAIFAKHGQTETNTGLSEGQIAMFTQQISLMTDHLKRNPKDFGTQRSLIKTVGKRRSLLDYLKNRDINRYRAIIKELNIRK
jgi:small subunit ribosomal protein S15